MNEFKSGFVSIIGRPNVGKSTLLNSIIGEKVSIMTHKPQTTRTKINGIYNSEDSQIIFVDTPGIHKPKHKLGKIMNDVVDEAINEVDLLIFIIEADSEEVGRGDEFIIEKIKASGLPCILVINKIDLIKRDKLLTLITLYTSRHDFIAVVPIAASKNDGVELLLKEIKNNLGEGPKYYADDEYTNQTERQLVEETIREKALKLLDEEIPHGIVVEVESMKILEKKISGEQYYNIEANIYCEKNSHKGIIIGKDGDMLKRISTYARHDLEAILGQKVNLKTWVKVKDDWRDNEKLLNNFFKPNK